jgi:carboxypeptidase C (cathepsin A)
LFLFPRRRHLVSIPHPARAGLLAVLFSGLALSQSLAAQDKAPARKDQPAPVSSQQAAANGAPGADSVTEGTVTVGGKAIAYRAVAGTLTVAGNEQDDARLSLDGKWLPDSGVELPAKPQDQPATARMFYTAYFARDAAPGTRPVTFLYNGGPGSATMYLHMGAFGPRRIVTSDTQHDTAAPYHLVDNQYSLLDASDLVFIDAPGTGFSRIQGKDAPKAFWGTDQDAHAFDRFIRRWLTKYNRWTSPKYLFGESYGTTRSAVLSNMLRGVDLNGVVLLSQILSFDDTADGPGSNPGTEQAYFLALPSMAATAWYHHRVPNQPADLQTFLHQVEQYSLGEYASALLQGADLPQDRKQAVAQKLEGFTGVPAAYWLKANLRVDGSEFSKELETETNTTVGRLDTRYQGPSMNPLSQGAQYDPFTNAITSAYQAAINEYARQTLKYGENMTYKPSAYGPDFHWDLQHRPPGVEGWEGASVNVMPDLAMAMKRNPKMHVMLMGGYFDLGTLYFGATYEMKHLPIPQDLQSNISYHFYQTGHMVYVSEPALKQLHDYTAALIHSTESGR